MILSWTQHIEVMWFFRYVITAQQSSGQTHGRWKVVSAMPILFWKFHGTPTGKSGVALHFLKRSFGPGPMYTF